MKDQEQETLPDIELEYQLRERWLRFWQRVGAAGDPQQYFDDIAKRYAEEQRAYHTLEHIAHCLQEFDEVRDTTHNANAVEMALWFHDVVYQREKDDEEKSAVYAKGVASAIGLSSGFAEEVGRLILTTKHTSIPDDIDARLLGDIDISILGQAPAVFDRYEDNIRREYDFVDEEPFRRGRSAVMESFAQRQTIFSTDYFKAKYQDQAVTNIQRSLGRWKP